MNKVLILTFSPKSDATTVKKVLIELFKLRFYSFPGQAEFHPRERERGEPLHSAGDGQHGEIILASDWSELFP